MGWLEEVLAHEKQADALAREGKYREALGHYRAALALCPGECGTRSIEEGLEEKIRKVGVKAEGDRLP